MLKRVLIFIFVLVLLGFLSIYYPEIKGYIVKDGYEREQDVLVKVIDGDTIETDLGTIRLLGINTPEKGKHYYQEALDYLKQFEGNEIEILRDFEDEDKYNRKLRYVFISNRLLNIEILEQGLATSFMLDDLRYEGKLRKAEEFAMNNELGLWKKSNDDCVVFYCLELIELNPEDEFFILRNNCNFDCHNYYVKDDANHFFEINEIKENSEIKVISKTNIWNNDGDRFFMRDNQGGLVLFYEY